MPLLRLAYTTQFLVALIAIFVVWDEVGAAYHLELMPWWMKLGLGTGVAYAAVRATASAVAGGSAWNHSTLRWCAAMLALLMGCAVANYYCNVYGEENDERDGPDTSIAAAAVPIPGSSFARSSTNGGRGETAFHADGNPLADEGESGLPCAPIPSLKSTLARLHAEQAITSQTASLASAGITLA